MKKRARLLVFGVVQGVGYRAFAMRAAWRSQLGGYVRNLREGSVEVVVEGEEEPVRSFIDRLRAGPAGAAVERVEVEWEEYKGEFDGFDIRF